MAKLKTLGSRISTMDHRRVKPAHKVVESFYVSAAWRNLMDTIIAQRGRICEDPKCPKPHPPISRIFGDHIIERRDGGADLDPNNVQLLCGAAHTRKTMRARAARAGLTLHP